MILKVKKINYGMEFFLSMLYGRGPKGGFAKTNGTAIVMRYVDYELFIERWKGTCNVKTNRCALELITLIKVEILLCKNDLYQLNNSSSFDPELTL